MSPGRRHAVAALAIILALLPNSVRAQAAAPASVRIGWLTTGPHPFIADFRRGLRELGWIEGQNAVVIERYSQGSAEDRMAQVAREITDQRLDVLVVSGALATRVANQVVRSVPIVSVSPDPVALGVAASLARPGGNVTGLGIVSAELSAKWVELVKATFPGVSRLAVLVDPAGSPAEAPEAAARAVGLIPTRLTVTRAEELEGAFQAAVRARANALVVVSSALFASQRHRIVALASEHRLPAVYEHRAFVEAGGLMSYGPDLGETFRRAAGYVDRVVRGARPADLPIEQPTRFELVINERTARSLGLSIPAAVRARADQVLP